MLYLVILLNILTLRIVVKKTKSIITPFSIVILSFLIIAIFTTFNLLLPSNPYFHVFLETKTKFFILIFTLCLLFISTQIKNTSLQYTFKINSRLRIRTIFYFLSFLIFIVTVLTFIKNNFQMPLFIINSDFESGKGSHYSEYNIPFLTPLSFGVNIVQSLLLSFSFVSYRKKLKMHISKNKLLYILLLVSTIELLGIGLRNVMIWPFVIFFFSFTFFNKIKIKKEHVFFVLTIILLFVAIGNFRMGVSDLSYNPFNKFVNIKTGSVFLDTTISWILLYFGTSYQNLNAMIMSPPQLTYGLGILSDFIPDVFISGLFSIPPEPIAYLKDNNLLPYFGFTFRTYFTDFIPDLGYWGALILGVSIYAFMVWLYNKSQNSPKYFKYYIALIPAFLMSPFLNKFSGLVTLFPLLFLFVFIKLQKVIND
jgi:oligosaccharide repeat unit polymerase